MIQQLDFAILDYIQENLRCDTLDFLVPKITLLAEYGIFFIGVAVVLLFIKSRRCCGIAMLTGMGSGLLIGNVLLKNLIARPRPCWINTDVLMLIAVPDDYSFPSGHTLSCFIAATILLYYDRRLGIPAAVIAVLVGFSRLYLYVHFPSDVVAGAVLGIGIGIATVFIVEKISRSRINIGGKHESIAYR